MGSKTTKARSRRIGVVALAAVALFVGVLVVRAARLTSRQVKVPPGPAMSFDVDGAVGRLAGALRIRTVSPRAGADLQPFSQLHDYLAESFVRVHGELERTVVSRASLLYEWKGTQPDLDPVLLVGHLDVVPVEPESEADWTHPSFSGQVADGYVWGRGALDMKQAVVAQLEAHALNAPRPTLHPYPHLHSSHHRLQRQTQACRLTTTPFLPMFAANWGRLYFLRCCRERWLRARCSSRARRRPPSP